MNLSEELKSIIKGEVTEDGRVVVCPADVSDLTTLVNFVNQSPGLSLIGRSAGSDMGGGVLLDPIWVSFVEHFNSIIEIGKEFGVAQSGVAIDNFEKAALKKGLSLPLSLGLENIGTIWELVNLNLNGSKDLLNEDLSGFVEEVKVVLRDGNEYGFNRMREDGLRQKMAQRDLEGEIYRKIFELLDKNRDLILKFKARIPKQISGYQIWDVWKPGENKNSSGRPSGIVENGIFDMSKLFVGSGGTLGLLTEVKLGLVPVKDKANVEKISETVETELNWNTLETEQIASVFEQIKQIFDPNGMFNPRKKVGVTQESSEKLLMTKS